MTLGNKSVTKGDSLRKRGKKRDAKRREERSKKEMEREK